MDATSPPMRPSPEQAAASRREVARRHRKRRDKLVAGKPHHTKGDRLAAIRLSELQRLYIDRWGIQLPHDDSGRDDAEILVDVALRAGKDPRPIIELSAPWMGKEGTEYLINAAEHCPSYWTADELGERLNLTYAVRSRLGITTIGSIDANKAERERLRREKWNEKKRRKRSATAQAAKLKPREMVVLEAIGLEEQTVPRLTEQLRRRRAFRGLAADSLRVVVHRVLNRLLASERIVVRTVTRPQGGRVRCMQRQR